MEILNKETDNNGLFYIEKENKKIAELQYELVGNDRLIIHHTVVSDELAGKGIGKQLVDKVVDLARKNKLKIVPVCSFAKKVLSSETYRDIL